MANIDRVGAHWDINIEGISKELASISAYKYKTTLICRNYLMDLMRENSQEHGVCCMCSQKYAHKGNDNSKSEFNSG